MRRPNKKAKPQQSLEPPLTKTCLTVQRKVFTLSITLLCLLMFSTTCKADKLYVAVAANFSSTIKTLQRLFEAQSKHRLIISSASTGQLYTQIHHGAPYEVFLSADSLRPEKLITDKLAEKESSYIYAWGQLALWSADRHKITTEGEGKGEHLLKTDTLSRLVIPNPELAPYGYAAKQLMKHLELYDLWQNRLITAQNTAQAQQFTLSGSVPFAFIPLSQIKALPAQQQGSHWLAPSTYYSPIEQRLVLLKKGAQNPAASAFLKFIKSAQAQQIIADAGYLTESSH